MTTDEQRRSPASQILEDIVDDLRYGFRRLIKRPAFSLTIILTLGLSVGINIVVFSLVNALLVRGLPYLNGSRLLILSQLPVPDFEASASAFKTWKLESNLLQDAALYDIGEGALLGGPEPQQLKVSNVTSNFFPVLGVTPVAGRAFAPEEEESGHTDVAMISEGLWRSRFGSSESVLGSQITLNGRRYSVIGIVPSTSRFPSDADVWTPTAHIQEIRTASNASDGYVLGLMQSSSRVAQVDAQQRTWLHNHHLDQTNSGDLPAWLQSDPIAQPLKTNLLGGWRHPTLLLFGAVLLVLLIGCVNVANLILADSTLRAREFAVRRALGMAWTRLLRQLITEHILVAVLGGLAGLCTAYLSLPYVKRFLPQGWPQYASVGVDVRVLGFALGLSMLVGTIMGLGPFYRLSKGGEALSAGARASEPRRRRLARQILVSLETCLALVLLVAAALVIQSFRNLMVADNGYNPESILAASVFRPRHTPQEAIAARSFYNDVLSKLAVVRGAQGAGGIDHLPMRPQSVYYFQQIRPESQAGLTSMLVSVLIVTPGYFKTFEIPLLQGRNFDEQDDLSRGPVVIVDRTVAQQLWPGQSPIGHQMFIPSAGVARVVGICGHIGLFGPNSIPVPEVYRVLTQAQPPRVFSFVVRATSGSGSRDLADQVRSAVRSSDPNQPLEIETMASYLSLQFQRPRGVMFLLSVLSTLGFVLAIIGVYGLVSYSVASRTREFGIRAALGEQPGRIYFRAVSGATRPVLVAIIIGIVISLATGKLLQFALFGVKATDMMTLVTVALSLIGSAMLASAIAARPATAVDPVVALREE